MPASSPAVLHPGGQRLQQAAVDARASAQWPTRAPWTAAMQGGEVDGAGGGRQRGRRRAVWRRQQADRAVWKPDRAGRACGRAVSGSSGECRERCDARASVEEAPGLNDLVPLPRRMLLSPSCAELSGQARR
eukprot:2159390-Prymnesium_polylepis.1